MEKHPKEGSLDQMPESGVLGEDFKKWRIGMNGLNEIERASKEYSEARQELGDLVYDLQRRIEEVKHPMIRPIKRSVAKVADRHAKLHHLVESHPECFDKPKTVVFHGVKVGYKKLKGGIVIEDEERVIQLIRRHMPDQADALIKTSERPVKAALGQLTVAELKRLGCTVEDTTDHVYIHVTDSEVDKAVDALLKNAIDEEDAA